MPLSKIRSPLLSLRRQPTHLIAAENDFSGEEYIQLFSVGGKGHFVQASGKFNISQRKWSVGIFLLRDIFHILLELRLFVLFLVIFCAYVCWATLLASVLAVITLFDHRYALGEQTNSTADYYFFVVETMFAIGFGSPRYPACSISDCYVTVIIVSTTILNGIMLGVIFSKFSSSASRRYSLLMSDSVCGRIHPKDLCLAAHTDVPINSDHNNPISQDKTNPEVSADTLFERISADCSAGGGMGSGSNFRSCSQFLSSHHHNIVSHMSTAQTGFWGLGNFSKASTPISEYENYYSLSFRLINITAQSFFQPSMRVYILHHSSSGLVISEFSQFHIDVPLQFFEVPVIVTLDSRDPESPLHCLSAESLRDKGSFYELLVTLSFTDTYTASPAEIRSSWRLDSILWGSEFKNIVCRKGCDGAYEVDIQGIDTVEDLQDPINTSFRQTTSNQQLPADIAQPCC